MVSINLNKPGEVDCTISFPAEWNELLPDELLAFCKRQLAQFKTLHEQVVAVFNDIFLIRCKPVKKSLPTNFQLMLDPEDATINGLPLVDFLYRENKLTKQLFPVIKLPGFALLHSWRRVGLRGVRAMRGPEENFDNLTCGEFEDAEFFFNEFVKTPTANALAHLASILWRPHKIAYMQFCAKQHKWITYDHEKMYKRFLLLPQHQLYAFFVWYAGCRSMMPLIFPTVYKKSTDEKKTNEPDLFAFTKCIHSSAGPKNGSREDIRRTLLKEFFMELELEAINAEKLIEEYGKR